MTEATKDTKASRPADEAVWERWSKKRTFVRALEGNSRIVKPMGFDWFEQLKHAEGI